MKKLCSCLLLAVCVMLLCCSAYGEDIEAQPLDTKSGGVFDRRDPNHPEKTRKLEYAGDGYVWWVVNYGLELTKTPTLSGQDVEKRTPWAIVSKNYGTGEDVDDRKMDDINYLLNKGIPANIAESVYSVEYGYQYENDRIFFVLETVYLDGSGRVIYYEKGNSNRKSVKLNPVAREALMYARKAEDKPYVWFRKTEGTEPHQALKPWHPKAKCQITSWKYNEKTKKVTLTILHKSGKTTTATASFKTNKGDEFFLVKQLPAGLQVVMPDDSEGTWVVNVDSRSGYVAKIEDPENIASSNLNNSSNKDDYGGKTFESGEAFIILKSSGMTIRPPVY